jgi:cell wall-associated NlpC family hydrolase
MKLPLDMSSHTVRVVLAQCIFLTGLIGASYTRRMINLRIAKQQLTLALLAAVLSCALPAAAQTQSAPQDDMAAFLSEKGLVEKLGDQVSTAGRAVSEKASELVVAAMGFLGVPYKRGGNSFDQGLDCSGFVRLVYEQTAGLLLPRRAAEQAAATQPIDKSELQPGDLVFFNTLRATFSHVGIYVGDHKFIHSPRTGAVVRVEDMRVGYWQQRFDGARRVNAQEASASPK